MVAPKVPLREALSSATEHFIDCIVNGLTPTTDGEFGARIVSMVEDSERSIVMMGEIVNCRGASA